MKPVFQYIFYLTLMCCFSKSAAITELGREHFSIRGRIIDSSGKGLGEVPINILKGQNTFIKGVTDSLGRFILDIPDTGKYIIEYQGICKNEVTLSGFSHNNIRHQTISSCNGTEMQYDIVISIELPPIYQSRPYYKGWGDINKIFTSEEIEKGAY